MVECRIFLPILSPKLRQRSNGMLDKYSMIIQEFISNFELHDESSDSKKKERTDVYVVTSDNYGLKYRSKKSLELKVRTEVNSPFIETWEKFEIGEKSKNAYLNPLPVYDIINTLQSFLPFREQDMLDLEIKRLIHIKKCRIKSRSAENKQEICLLTIKSTNNDVVTKWITFCFENDNAADLSRELPLLPFIREILTAMDELVNVYQSSDAMAEYLLQSKIIPVVGGYPYWINTIRNSDSVDRYQEAIDFIHIMR